MIHLSWLLLHLQYSYLFICSFHFHVNLFFLFLYLFITTQIQFSQCSINLQWFTYLVCSFWSNVVICSFVLSFSFPSFFIFHSYSSPNRTSLVNVVLTFNDSLILFAPSSPISFPVHLFISFSFPSLFPFVILIHHHSDPVQSM